MAGAAGDDEEDGMTGINVVPLVDIMLVLLIIFMVSTEFVQQELKNKIPPNIPVELPRAASAEETEPSLLSLVINKDGDLFLNGKEATQAEVKTYVDEMKGKGSKMQAVIAALTNALGVTHIDMPATPQAIWEALQSKKEAAE